MKSGVKGLEKKETQDKNVVVLVIAILTVRMSNGNDFRHDRIENITHKKCCVAVNDEA